MSAKEESRNEAGKLGVIDRDCRGENKSGHRVTRRVTLLSWPWGRGTDEIKLILPGLGCQMLPGSSEAPFTGGGGQKATRQLLWLAGLSRTDLRQPEGDLSPLRILFPCLVLRKGFTHGRGQEGSSCPIVSVLFRWQTVSPSGGGGRV